MKKVSEGRIFDISDWWKARLNYMEIQKNCKDKMTTL